MISWKTTKEEAIAITRITDRFCAMWPGHDKLEVAMDLTACHANGCPLDLVQLADADDSDLGHDVGGIRANLNRDTGKLEGTFRPRFSVSKQGGSA